MTVFPGKKYHEKPYWKAVASIAFCRDHMQWSQEEEENAKKKATENSLVKVQSEDQGNKFQMV